MSKISVIAHLYVRKQHLAEVKTALINAIEPTLKEQGCLKYELHVDHSDETHFIFIEEWASQSVWENGHKKTAHFKALGAALEGKTSSVLVVDSSQIA